METEKGSRCPEEGVNMHGKDMKTHAELMDIVKQLRKASALQAEQADRIEKICMDMMGGARMKSSTQPEAIMISIGAQSPMSQAGEEMVMVMEPGHNGRYGQ